MILVLRTQAAWLRLSRAVDEAGPDVELPASLAFAIDTTTGLQVLGRTPTRAKIRVLDGPHAGRTGWILPEVVHPPVVASQQG